MALRILAPAKLNLCLNVVGRRDDGFHRLDSLFSFVDLADELTIGPSAEPSVSIRGEFAMDLDPALDDLAARARDLVLAEAGVVEAIAITIDKRIPVAAGLGGGSADAAAALWALNEHLQLDWPLDRLLQLAAKLGADTPACLLSRPVIARGIGDELTPASAMPRCAILLVNPRIATPTPAVFKAFRTLNPVVADRDLEPLPDRLNSLHDLVGAIEPRGNDLLPAALRVTPAIAEVLERLHALPEAVHAGLSGSGATCFALFETQESAEEAALDLGLSGAWWTWAGGWHEASRRVGSMDRR